MACPFTIFSPAKKSSILIEVNRFKNDPINAHHLLNYFR
jgi:hypothetical protein